MSCKNWVDVWVESGYHGKNVEFTCGMTGPHGTVELCEECLTKANKNYPQGWRHHPGDICVHGTYLNPNHDCCCGDCENGVPANSEFKCHCGQLVYFPMGWQSELDCPRCDMNINLPSTEEQRIEWLAEIDKEIEEVKFTGKLRVMRKDECGHESCVLVIADDDAAQYTIAGVEQAYPESNVWTEQEVNQRYQVEQFMLDD